MPASSGQNDKPAEPRRGERPTLLSDNIYQQLFNQVVDGELKHHARLSGEYQLAEKYGVSRRGVRDALKRLRSEGLIESPHGTGSWVTFNQGLQVPAFAPINSIADIRRCYELRIADERETAYLAAQRVIPRP